MSRAADRARQIAQGNAHRYMFDRFDDGGDVDQPEQKQRPDVPVGGAVGQTLHRVTDWWKQQPSWLEQAKAIHEQSDPKVLRPTEAAIDFASNLPGVGTIGGAGGKAAKPFFPARPRPTPGELAAAQADTRVSGDIVGRRLDTIVPDSDRVVGGSYTPGAPGGGKWSDLPEQTLSRPGPGFRVTDQELQKAWDESVAASSQAAKNAVTETGARPVFGARDWDAAMRLPLRDVLWYELSGEAFHHNLPQLTPAEHVRLMDLVGATSAQAKPGENVERALATLSQHMRGVPVDVDLTQPTAVRSALARPATGSSALPGNKTGYFSDTLTLTGGVPTRYPISVNDVWVGRMFGINDEQLTQHQSLHEPMAIYHNKLRDIFNQRHQSEVGFPLQSWNFQAPSWVRMRGEGSGTQTGDAYYQVWPSVIAKLEAAGVPGVHGNVITRQALMDPRFADALRSTTNPFRVAPKATVEFGTTQTNAGRTAHDLYQRALKANDVGLQDAYLKPLVSAMYHSGRGGEKPWDMLKRAITGLSQTEAGITRISYPTVDAPLDVGGTFEGAVSPNIRIPLKNMNDEQIAYFNAVAGKQLRQDAMASSIFRPAEAGAEPAEGHIRTHSLFVPTTERMDAADIRSLAQAMAKEGHGMSYERYPNGYEFGVIPRFAEDGPHGADIGAVERAYDASLASKFGPHPIVRPHDFKSVYTEAGDYGKLRTALVNKIKNEFISEAINAGIPKDQARLLASEAGNPSALTGRAKSAWAAYGSRLRDLASAEASFNGFADRIGKAHADFIPKAEKRLNKKGFSGGGRASTTDTSYRTGGAIERALALARGGAAKEHEVDGRLRDLRVRSIVRRKPRIIHDYDIPYVAGCSNDLEKLYVDRDFLLEEILDLEALWLHESGEALFMRLFHDEYDTAHRLITVAEKRLVLKHGHKWEAYNAPFQRYAKHAEHERIRRVPKDLFMAPYLESGDNALVRHMRACMR